MGAGYLNTTGAKSSFNAFAQASEKFGKNLHINAGVAYTQLGGPREDDSQNNAEAVLGADFWLGLGHKIHFDADFFYGKTKTTPYNSFLNGDATMQIVREVNADDSIPQERPNETTFTSKYDVSKARIQALSSTITPSKDDRGDRGDGIIESTQMRGVASLGYEAQPTKNMIFDITGFAAMNTRKYDTHEIYLPYYGYLSFAGNSHWTPIIATINALGEKYGMPYADQSGSKFDENKFGGKLKLEVNHNNGLFAIGVDSTYEMGKRKPKQFLRSAYSNFWGATGTKQTIRDNVEANIQNELDINKFTNSFYLRENYSFNSNFSLMGGFRYEMINYSVKAHDIISISTFQMQNYELYETNIAKKTGTSDIEADFKKDYDTFTFELAPAFRYSNTGAIYARFETGYATPPGYALLLRGIDRAKYAQALAETQQPDTNLNPQDALATDNLFTYSKNDELKQETYMTYELGWKDYIGKRVVPLGFTDFEIDAMLFAANVFYTTSKNEFYFTGDPYSQLTYGTYDKSRRMGVELALEQYLFGGVLGLNESFTYLKAERFSTIDGEEKWNQIPYTYDYKATFGGNFNVAGMVEIIDISVNLWIQNSLYGNQRVVARDYDANTQRVSEVEKDLDPYLISDLGLSFGFNKNALMLTAGVKNVFDTFYYDYYNADRSASINENRYLIGRGRTVFLEAQYKY